MVRFSRFLAIAGCFAALGCQGIIDGGASALGLATTAGGGSAQQDVATVHWFDTADVVAGARSKLVRNDAGVTVTLQTNGLSQGHAVTLWIVVFNKPGMCSDPCGEDDLWVEQPDGTLTDSPAMVDVMGVGGHVIGGSGKATFSGHRSVGDNSGSIFEALGLTSWGLMDARMAELHFVVRDHGPKIPGLVSEMISTFGGGCQDPDVPDPDLNQCVDVQFSVHLP